MNITFFAHRHSVKTNKANNDSSITFDIDQTQTKELIPLLSIEPDSSLKVTVETE